MLMPWGYYWSQSSRWHSTSADNSPATQLSSEGRHFYEPLSFSAKHSYPYLEHKTRFCRTLSSKFQKHHGSRGEMEPLDDFSAMCAAREICCHATLDELRKYNDSNEGLMRALKNWPLPKAPYPLEYPHPLEAAADSERRDKVSQTILYI